MFHKKLAGVTTIAVTRAGAMMVVTVLLMSAACGGERKTETQAGGSPADLSNYRTVRIGNLTWTAENLNHQTENSWCYDNDDSNCEKYGRLYTWDVAMTICPDGWRLPSDADWDDLIVAAGGNEIAGTRLRSTSGWSDNNGRRNNGNGTDDYGFSALPGGNGWNGSSFNAIGSNGWWWSATTANTVNNMSMANLRVMIYGGGYVIKDNHPKSSALSVRCVRD